MNKADIETKTVKVEGQGPQAEMMALIQKAGEIIRPSGFVLVGFAGIHLYQSQFAVKPTYEAAAFQSLGGVEEGFADYGMKLLREAMMNAYGRTPPKKRS